eukprot:298762-Pelagomonas_calceolata.AAC.1
MPYNCRLLSDDEIDQSEASELFEPDEPREVVEVWDVADAALSWVNKIAAFPRCAGGGLPGRTVAPRILDSGCARALEDSDKSGIEGELGRRTQLKAATSILQQQSNMVQPLQVANSSLPTAVPGILCLFEDCCQMNELKAVCPVRLLNTFRLFCMLGAVRSFGLGQHNHSLEAFSCAGKSWEACIVKLSIVLLKSPKVLSEGQESSEGSFGDTPMDVSPGIPVGMLSQLRSLSLECMVFKGAVDLGCLRGLQHLHCFSIHFCNVINLDIMLQHVPLYKLSLDDLCSPSSICFASSTLRVLELHQLEIWNFKLSLEQVPSIQCVSFTGIMFKERSGDFHDEHLAALALSRFPLTIPATFVIDFEIGWSAEQQVAALLALLPLKPDLSLHVNELLLGPWVLNLPSIQALSGLFGSVGTLNLCFHHIRSRQGAMLDILQGMPSVLCVRVAMMNALPDPLWWVAVFQSVHQARRGLVLKFGNWNRPYTWPITRGQHTAIREVFRAWQESQRALSGPPTIWLGVDREEG